MGVLRLWRLAGKMHEHPSPASFSQGVVVLCAPGKELLFLGIREGLMVFGIGAALVAHPFDMIGQTHLQGVLRIVSGVLGIVMHAERRWHGMSAVKNIPESRNIHTLESPKGGFIEGHVASHGLRAVCIRIGGCQGSWRHWVGRLSQRSRRRWSRQGSQPNEDTALGEWVPKKRQAGFE